MTKRTICITVDEDTHNQLKTLNINVSGSINDYLRGLVEKSMMDVDGINIKLERIKLGKFVKKLQFYQENLQKTQKNIEKWEENRVKLEEKRLSEEKERIEKSKRCINCGNIYEISDYKWNEFKGGIVCKSCFMKSSKEDIDRWNTK